MSDLRKQLESILFAAGKKLSIEEFSKLTREKDLNRIISELKELQKELDEKESSIMLVQEGDYWKFSVREKYLPFVRKIVTQTELPKSIIETLAVVSFKAPVLQSLIIKIRTNKAYSHLEQLEEMGYISREKKGRTKLIKLTQKFFEYFDVPPEKLKERFSGFQELDKVISEKEKELEAEESRRMKKPEVDLVAKDGHKEKLETYETLQRVEEDAEMLMGALEKVEVNGLEVYYPEQKEKHQAKHEKEEEKHKEGKTEKKEAAKEKIGEEKTESAAEIKKEEYDKEEKEPGRLTVEKIAKEAKKKKARQRQGQGLFPKGMPADVEKKVDERVKEIVGGEAQKQEIEENEEQTSTEQPERNEKEE